MNQPPPARELYVYWRAAPAQRDAAVATLAAWHAQLAARLPALVTARRIRDDAQQVTLMEVYRHPGGIDAALQALLQAEGDALTAACRSGARHVEAFDALP